ncbi:MAG: DinB family protein [Tepidiformaceae bacterium]
MQSPSRSDDLPRTVAELLALVARERGAIEQAVAGLSDDALAAQSDGWSPKDHLAHVAAWERRLVAEVQGETAASRFMMDQATWDAADSESVNAMLHARHHDEPPATVLADFRASGGALRALLATLTDSDLLQPVRPDDPDVDSLVELIAWDTFRHYPEHARALTGQG